MEVYTKEGVDALVKAKVDAERKRVIENCTEVIDIHAAAAVKERDEAVKAADAAMVDALSMQREQLADTLGWHLKQYQLEGGGAEYIDGLKLAIDIIKGEP